MSIKLSVTIITKNEEHNIERCLKSVQWADEIVVVDDGSTDRTPEICQQFTPKVIHSDWLGFGLLKQLAVNSAIHDWIFSIDSDEEVSEPLKEKIMTILENPQLNGFRIKRESFYLGKKIRHCGWERDYQLRLFNRKFGNFNDKPVHESVSISGEVGKIEEPLYHYTYPTVQSHIEKMNRYSDLGLELLVNRQKRASIGGAVMRGLAKFFKMYILQRGFLDGKIGFVLCYNSAFGVYLKYLKLWEKNR
ncbi:MAG: glycosyltransferase family 2 protein [bacterium]|nr:glycosyltransferase family 2 protein [bacterium]